MAIQNFILTDLLAQARQKGRDSHKAGETAKLGVLRAGSTGAMAETGEIVGHCHRKSLLRSKGIELDPPTIDKLLMFELGFANEDIVYDQLVAALPSAYTILREEEIPIEWLTTNGTKVTGRPDMVICEQTSSVIVPVGSTVSYTVGGGLILNGERIPSVSIGTKPVLGLELKSIHSMWTARDVLFGGEPKLNNLLQAAHYMHRLGVPYKLHYKSYSQLGQGVAGGKSWVASLFPKQGEPGSEYLEYNDQGNIKHIKQFEIVYDLEYSAEGRLQYRLEGSNKWTTTIISNTDIERYYEYVSKMEEAQVLGPRPLTLHASGKKMNYTDCQYCKLASTCDAFEKQGYAKWLAEVQKVTQGSTDSADKV